MQAIAMALGVCGATLAEPPVGVLTAVGALVVALLARRPWLVVFAVVLVAGGRAHVEADEYRPLPQGAFDGTVSLITDPEARTFGWSAEGRLLGGRDEGARVRLSVPWSAGDIGEAVAGTRLRVAGTVVELEPNAYLRSRHLRGSLRASDAVIERGPRWWRVPSELIRDRVVAGAAGIPAQHRPLYVGLVIGDDREQSLGQQIRFRVAGMSHLLAVSGQNVAFVLAVLAPALGRMPPRARWLLTIAALSVFAVATRLEPSVMRATVSAGIAATAVVAGRRSAGIRSLSLAVTALLVIDPFLVRSVGFVLSVGASFGIVVLGAPLADRLGGPRPVAEAIAITTAAQIAVAPVLIITFGPVSAASVPANVAAGWAAGVVMVWGASVGLAVGGLPATWQPIVSSPAAVLVGWIDWVARVAVTLPLPPIGWTGAVVLVAATATWWGAGSSSQAGAARRLRSSRTPLALLAIGVLSVATGRTDMAARSVDLGGGGALLSGEPRVLVVDARPTPALVESLVEARVRSLDIVVLTGGDRWSATIVEAIDDVVEVELVLAPRSHRVPGATSVREPLTLEHDLGAVRVETVDGQLVVSVHP